MKTSYYQVIHYKRREDGRIEPAGMERRALSVEEAQALSYSAIVVSLTPGFEGSATYIYQGRHAQFDSHLGWLS